MHEAARCLALAELATGVAATPAPSMHFHLTDEERGWADRWLAERAITGRVLVVHPGAGAAVKLWPAAAWGEALQALAGVTTVVFDKTGTLTMGRPELTAVQALADADPDVVLRLAAAVQARSEHPLARALVRRLQGHDLPEVAQFASVPGQGVSGRVEGHEVRVGKPAWLRDAGVHGADDDERVLVAVDGRAQLALAFADPVRPEARAVVQRLHALGLKTLLLSGDRQATAARVAAELGITEVVADVDPAGKAAVVANLVRRGERVAMVGDGVNDAPALVEAEVGIAMGQGADVARAVGGWVLLRPDLRAVVDGIGLSRATLRTIRRNLMWAFGYNVAAIPLAAGVLAPWGVWLQPAWASAAMALRAHCCASSLPCSGVTSAPTLPVAGSAPLTIGTWPDVYT